MATKDIILYVIIFWRMIALLNKYNTVMFYYYNMCIMFVNHEEIYDILRIMLHPIIYHISIQYCYPEISLRIKFRSLNFIENRFSICTHEKYLY